jgi:hypothetical protein
VQRGKIDRRAFMSCDYTKPAGIEKVRVVGEFEEAFPQGLKPASVLLE